MALDQKTDSPFEKSFMRVLITGGMGVIGSFVAEKFVREGHRPVLYARHKDENLIRDILNRVDIELGDILDLPRLLQVIKAHRITHIVHTAAFVGALSQANPALSVQVNVMGTLNVLEAARLFEVKRVVYTSAKGVYGDVRGEYAHPTYKPLPEEHAKNPVRIYDAAKFMGENMGQFYLDHYGIDFIALRFSTTYGPGKTARHGKMGVTSAIVENPFYGKPFRMTQGGEQRDDFVYNKDAALGVYQACLAKGLKQRVFNIGTGVDITMRDFARVIQSYLPQADIEIGPGLNYLDSPTSYYSIYDISKARAELDYQPQFDLARGIADYLEILKKNS